MGFSSVIAGRNAVFVCKLARYDFTGERGYLGTDAFATGKHKHEAREQQDCRNHNGYDSGYNSDAAWSFVFGPQSRRRPLRGSHCPYGRLRY